jgi:4-amino-4-deoxy-L-arabinose transferase-like glycosyltransferase
LLFVGSLAAALFLCVARRPAGSLGGLTDEYFPLGVNLAAHGTLGWGTTPIVFRPPGYPAFVALVLRATTPVPPVPGPEYLAQAGVIVCIAQAALLAATSVLLFEWLRRRVRASIAFTAALLYGVNPYSLILVGLVHYDVLHLFLTVAGCIALETAVERRDRAWLGLLAAGVLWGLTTLVRPLTLLLPPFVWLALHGRGLRGWRVATALCFFVAGMGLAIMPWTVRNYAVSGRLIPVNAQFWVAFWGSTAAKLRMDPNEYQWRGMAVTHYKRATGQDYDYLAYLRDNLGLEAAFREQSLRNLRAQPEVYLHNVLRGFATMNLQINTALVSAYQRIQRPGESASQAWFWEGAEDERRETLASRSFGVLVAALTLLAGYGIVSAWSRRDGWLFVPGAVYLCLCLAHTLTYMDFMYYYVKLPFLVVFAALGLEALHARGPTLGPAGRPVAAASVLAVLLSLLCLGGTLAVAIRP